MPDKYHSGVPMDHLPPARQRVRSRTGPDPDRMRTGLDAAVLAVWLFVYRTLRLWRFRQLLARRAIMRTIELRFPHEMSTRDLIMSAIRGGERRHQDYDRLEIATLIELARATGATMMANIGTKVPGLTQISNTQGAFQETVQTPPGQDQSTLSFIDIGGPNVVAVAVPTGVAATDQVNVQNSVNTVAARGGGQVQMQAGFYASNSTGRTDASVSYTGSGTNYTWTDAAITAADVGKYVVGPTNTRPPKIVSVTAGTGFVTDIPSFASLTTVACQIIAPSVVVPPGVTVSGLGNFATTAFATGLSSINRPTSVIDSGSGITFMFQGTQQTNSVTGYGGPYGLANMAVWGSTGGTPLSGGTSGSVWAGLYIPNGCWFTSVTNVDFEWQKTGGVVLDANMNAANFQNCSFQNIGTSAATTITGGVVMPYYNSVASAGINFYNSLWFSNYGVGIGGEISGFTNGGFAFNLYGCQLANTTPSSFATYSGYAIFANAGANGVVGIFGCWSGTNGSGAQGGDLWVNGGSVSIVNTDFTSSAAPNLIQSYGTVNITGGIMNTTGNAITNHGVVNWAGVGIGTGGTLYSGGPAATALAGVGSSQGVYLNNTAYTNP